jgi:hypothetical protein
LLLLFSLPFFPALEEWTIILSFLSIRSKLRSKKDRKKKGEQFEGANPNSAGVRSAPRVGLRTIRRRQKNILFIKI